GDGHGSREAALAAEGAGHGLVDQGHALGLPTGRDQRDPEVAEGAQLQVDVAIGPGQLEHPPDQRMGPLRVGLQEPPQQQQPALQRAGAGLAGDPLGPGQPAPGDGVVVEVRGPGDAEEDRRPGRPGGVPGPPEPGVGPLGRGHRGPGLAQPPQGGPQPVQRLGGLALLEGGGEAGPGLLPAAGGQGLPARRQVVLRGHAAQYAPPPRPEIGHLPDARRPRPADSGPQQATRTPEAAMTGPTQTYQLSVEAAEAYEARFVPALFADWAPHLVEAAGVAPGQAVL